MVAVVAGVVVVPKLLQCRRTLIVVRGQVSGQLMELCRLVDGKALARGCAASQEGDPRAAADLGQLLPAIWPGELRSLTERGAIVLGDELCELLRPVMAEFRKPRPDCRVGATS